MNIYNHNPASTTPPIFPQIYKPTPPINQAHVREFFKMCEALTKIPGINNFYQKIYSFYETNRYTRPTESLLSELIQQQYMISPISCLESNISQSCLHDIQTTITNFTHLPDQPIESLEEKAPFGTLICHMTDSIISHGPIIFGPEHMTLWKNASSPANPLNILYSYSDNLPFIKTFLNEHRLVNVNSSAKEVLYFLQEFFNLHNAGITINGERFSIYSSGHTLYVRDPSIQQSLNQLSDSFSRLRQQMKEALNLPRIKTNTNKENNILCCVWGIPNARGIPLKRSHFKNWDIIYSCLQPLFALTKTNLNTMNLKTSEMENFTPIIDLLNNSEFCKNLTDVAYQEPDTLKNVQETSFHVIGSILAKWLNGQIM